MSDNILAELMKIHGQPMRGRYTWRIFLPDNGRWVSGLPFRRLKNVQFTDLGERLLVYAKKINVHWSRDREIR
jgi:hypothetical protein